MGQDVLDVLRDIVRRGELPLGCRRAVLTLLPKKGDLTHLKNWRPVSLLCTDCKLLSKALALRLTKVLSSAKVNWAKSEAILVGEWGGERPTLPGGLVWKKDSFKYLGVYLGNNEFLNKKWEGTVENVTGRLSRWKRLVPRMSYRGTLVINNLAASFLWHKLVCVDPLPNLLASIQALLVDFFWDGLHWIPQSVLHLPKEEEGQGLVQLARRTAVFRLQFLQRLLTGPKDLIWRPVAHVLLHKLDIAPDLDELEGPLLECWGVREMDFGVSDEDENETPLAGRSVPEQEKEKKKEKGKDKDKEKEKKGKEKEKKGEEKEKEKKKGKEKEKKKGKEKEKKKGKEKEKEKKGEEKEKEKKKGKEKEKKKGKEKEKEKKKGKEKEKKKGKEKEKKKVKGNVKKQEQENKQEQVKGQEKDK
ncbi:hypothetical protein QTP86_011448 [Hemibagrus guttatus]|nr:hypothetical protein QTP86_011448 [Hemibagrus guttatus]